MSCLPQKDMSAFLEECAAEKGIPVDAFAQEMLVSLQNWIASRAQNPTPMTLTVHCCICGVNNEIFVESKRWDCESIDHNGLNFCPDHADCAPFFEKACPGCVETAPECSLFQSMPKSIRMRNVRPELRKGTCPLRTNGTFLMGSVEPVDLSEPAKDAGRALARACELLERRNPTQ